jgi:hypothetical protein
VVLYSSDRLRRLSKTTVLRPSVKRVVTLRNKFGVQREYVSCGDEAT